MTGYGAKRITISQFHYLTQLAVIFFIGTVPYAADAGSKLRVLSYESLLGKHGLAPVIEERFKANCATLVSEHCEIEFVKVSDLSGLLGKLRQDKRNSTRVAYQMVIGLDQTGYDAAASEGLVSRGLAFDESPYAIIVDTLKLSQKDWPKSWKEVPSKLSFSLLIEDPRTSTPGMGWLKSIYEFKLIKKSDASKVARRVFPSWSSAYSAFTQGEANAVWSYQTSEAYHRCNDPLPSGPRYRALPLEEGYPKQVELFARVALPQANGLQLSDKIYERFEYTMLKDLAVQEKIYTTQWMFPVNAAAKAPACYSGLTPVKALSTNGPISSKTLQKWIDDWALFL